MKTIAIRIKNKTEKLAAMQLLSTLYSCEIGTGTMSYTLNNDGIREYPIVFLSSFGDYCNRISGQSEKDVDLRLHVIMDYRDDLTIDELRKIQKEINEPKIEDFELGDVFENDYCRVYILRHRYDTENYALGGYNGNPFELYSDKQNQGGFNKNELLNYLNTRRYKKIGKMKLVLDIP